MVCCFLVNAHEGSSAHRICVPGLVQHGGATAEAAIAQHHARPCSATGGLAPAAPGYTPTSLWHPGLLVATRHYGFKER